MKTVEKPGHALVEDRKSKFYGGVHPAAAPAEVEAVVADYRARHPKARHVCYAYRLWTPDGAAERAFDAGEPRFTAGRPILNVLRREDVVNAVAVVVRYFGGILLGKGGLIRAYGRTAREALENAVLTAFQPKVIVQAAVPFAMLPTVERFLQRMQVRVIQRAFSAQACRFELEVTDQQQKPLEDYFRRHQLPYAAGSSLESHRPD